VAGPEALRQGPWSDSMTEPAAEAARIYAARAPVDRKDSAEVKSGFKN
jgi:hypothetical protein